MVYSGCILFGIDNEFEAETWPGVHKTFFVWYPTVFPKNLSYEVRDCYYQKMRQKSRYKIEYIT